MGKVPPSAPSATAYHDCSANAQHFKHGGYRISLQHMFDEIGKIKEVCANLNPGHRAVAVVVLELLLLRFCCCLVTSAVSWIANSLMRRSARICLSWRLSHSKMKWPSESATLALLQHGQPSAAMSLPIWYLAGFLACCLRTCCHVWKVPCLAVARWWKPVASVGCRPARRRKAFSYSYEYELILR